MTKIERRRTVVTLFQGNFEADLAALQDKAVAAERAEADAPKRMTAKSSALAIAKEHDDLLVVAEESAVKVTVWAISYSEWGPLQDEHPPREDNPEDKQAGVNTDTFADALVRVSLVAPGAASSLDNLKALGEAALSDLGDISRVQYVKLRNAAWNVNVSDDALPKFSLVSALRQQRDLDSKLQNDSE